MTGKTVQEVADMFGVNYRSVIRYIRLGWLKAEKADNRRITIYDKDIEAFRDGRYARRWESKRKDYVPEN